MDADAFGARAAVGGLLRDTHQGGRSDAAVAERFFSKKMRERIRSTAS
jgi:hypothetical protein